MKLENFPIYQMDKWGLYAFISNERMYMITNSHGSNPKNDGFVVDKYITKKMVQKHYCFGRKMLTEKEFVALYKKFTESVLDKIINL